MSSMVNDSKIPSDQLSQNHFLNVVRAISQNGFDFADVGLEKKQTNDIGAVIVELDEQLRELLRKACGGNTGSELVMFISAIGLAFTQRGCSDFLISHLSPYSSGAVNLLLYRVLVDDQLSVREIIHSFQRQAIINHKHRDYDFSRFLTLLETNLKGYDSQLFHVGVTQSQSDLVSEELISRFGICFAIEKQEQDVRLRVFFKECLYPGSLIELLAQHVLWLLKEMMLQPDLPVAKLPLIPPSEKERIFSFCSNPQPYDRTKTVVDLFRAQVYAQPDRTIVHTTSGALTYEEIELRSNQLASRLMASHGLRPGDTVAVCMGRSKWIPVIILAIFKARGVYLPIDPLYHSTRTDLILNDSDFKLLLHDFNFSPSKVYQNRAINFSENIFSFDVSNDLHSETEPSDVAYLIYTSGSTGTPKGVRVTHSNLTNLIHGLNGAIDVDDEDHLLAITSVSFDISILELIWTLCRGISITIKTDPEGNHSYDSFISPGKKQQPLSFSLFYFSNHQSEYDDHKYDFVMESSKYADDAGYAALWVPERHFHEFGGIFPNPAVLASALAMVTKRISIRSGSVVLPLHDPIRLVENWSIVDNLSKGRVELSMASGWHPDDFVFFPQNYANRQERMYAEIEEVKQLWSGGTVQRRNGKNREIPVKIFPKPIQEDLPLWITTGGSAETFRSAGKLGAGVLTHFLGQGLEELKKNIDIYRKSLIEHGYSPDKSKVAVMLHTFIGDDLETVRKQVKEPFKNYLKTSADLLKKLAAGLTNELETASPQLLDEMVDVVFERYWTDVALLGTVDTCSELVKKLQQIGVTDIACLIDFGVDYDNVRSSLEKLTVLMNRFRSNTKPDDPSLPVSLLQTTPTLLRHIVRDSQSDQFISSLKKILIGGEKVPPSLLRELSEKTSAQVYNMYGPTETTVWSSYKKIINSEQVTIGQPLANTQILIVDDRNRILPVGSKGEIAIGGEGVSKGYWKRDELTGNRFVNIPEWSSRSEFYKTGDFGRWRPDGELEIFGRSDNQVKLRGHRIELEEIELGIMKFPGVVDAVVIAGEDNEGHGLLTGFYQSQNQLLQADLFKFLRTEFPAYMVPSELYRLPAIPLTSSGKKDRKALLKFQPPSQDKSSFETLSPTQAAVMHIWKSILGEKAIALDSVFFDIGGHSLRATQLVSRIHKRFNVKIHLREIFEHPTIRGLSKLIEESRSNVFKQIPALPPAEEYDLSFAQRRIWLLSHLKSDEAYNEVLAYTIEGSVDRAALIKSFDTLIDRYEILRTIFKSKEGTPKQQIISPSVFSKLVNFYDQPNSGSEEIRRELIRREAGVKFDLIKGPMIRASLFSFNDSTHLLVITVHLIVCDGWSLRLVIAELDLLYNHFKSDLHSELPLSPLRIQYKDYAAWQNSFIEGENGIKLRQYWRAALQNSLSHWDWPDITRPKIQSFDASSEVLKLKGEVWKRISLLNQTEGVTSFMVLLSSVGALLYYYLGEKSFIIGTPVSGREDGELEDQVGHFLNVLPIPLNPRPADSFVRFLQDVRGISLDSFDHQDLPIDEIIDSLDYTLPTDRNPLYNVGFTFNNRLEKRNYVNTAFTELMTGSQFVKTDIWINAFEESEGVTIRIDFNRTLFDKFFIRDFTHLFYCLIERISLNPLATLSELKEELQAEFRKQAIKRQNEIRAKAASSLMASRRLK